MVNVLPGCSGEWKAEFIWRDAQNEEFETFGRLCVTCLQMSTVLLNECQTERGEKRHQFDKKLLKSGLGSRVAWDTSTAFERCACVGVCVCVFRGVGVVTLPAAVMLLAVQVVVRRL